MAADERSTVMCCRGRVRPLTAANCVALRGRQTPLPGIPFTAAASRGEAGASHADARLRDVRAVFLAIRTQGRRLRPAAVQREGRAAHPTLAATASTCLAAHRGLHPLAASAAPDAEVAAQPQIFLAGGHRHHGAALALAQELDAPRLGGFAAGRLRATGFRGAECGNGGGCRQCPGACTHPDGVFGRGLQVRNLRARAGAPGLKHHVARRADDLDAPLGRPARRLRCGPCHRRTALRHVRDADVLRDLRFRARRGRSASGP
eukprot:CAMPEP_0170209318 /NCGR_PEP_ID=MMETSP0116_2-20130129/4247_1 /TAXON_ID=400756 /ORGANISM="Durinskia baltica, Strain CSIRO CS-38" /LENGTH=261 /DNA_ID=CAMNT_0010459797 /DNA_START=43 /DNA_END=825 /DNA_ORIENTATION=+